MPRKISLEKLQKNVLKLEEAENAAFFKVWLAKAVLADAQAAQARTSEKLADARAALARHLEEKGTSE